MEYFSFDRPNSSAAVVGNLFSLATGEIAKKYYDGDVTMCEQEQSPHFELSMLLQGQYPMGVVNARSKYEFRRTWDHVRENKVNTITFRYVRSGILTVSQAGHSCELGAGDFAFTRSNIPMYYKSCASAKQPSDWLFIVLPLDLVHRYFPAGVPTCSRLSAPQGRRLIIAQVMAVLSAEGESLTREVIDDLISAMLKTTSEIVIEQGVEVESRQSIGEKRLEGIISLISLHLSNPDFSLSAAAKACKISPRYLCHLLKENGTAFSELLWKSRLEKSKEWLATLDKRRYGIGEIAFMTGFKSAAHFSRMFREHFGCSPSEYRRNEVIPPVEKLMPRYAS